MGEAFETSKQIRIHLNEHQMSYDGVTQIHISGHFQHKHDRPM